MDVLDIFLQEKLYDTMSYGVCRQVKLTMPKTADEVATTATRVEAANRAAEQIAKEKKGAQGAKIGQNKPKQSGRVFSDSSSYKSYTSSPSFQSSGPSSTRQLDDGMYDRPLCHICQSPEHFAKACPQRSYNRVQYSRPPPTVQHRSPIPLNPRGPAFHPRQPFVRPDMQRTSGRGITHRQAAVQLSETAPSHSVPSLCKHCADLEYDPKCVVKVNGIDVVGLRDTGATHCGVARELVRDSDYTGQYTELTTVSGHQYQVPIAQVDISSPFLYGRIAVGVMNQPEQKVLIGNLVSSAWEDETQKVPVYANPTYIMQVRTRARVKKDDLPIEALPVGQVVMEVTTDKLIELQREDPSLDSCAARAEHGVKTRHRRGEFKFVRDNGVLVRKFQDPRWKLTQICVPKSLRANLLQLAHDMPMGGHLGTNKTLKRLHKDFYWPGLTADVKMYCRSCPVCQKTMNKGRVPPVPVVHTPVVGEPFDKVGVDIIGPILPASDRHNRYVLVQVDYVTRYPEAIPMKSIEAENVAEKLIEMWSQTGIPKTVVTDQGLQFTSHIMKSVYRLLGIQGCTTTPYHAMANGLVEQFNQTLKKMKRVAKEKPRDWDKWIPAALFAYREVPQASTGFSPFELLYGRNVRGPMKLVKEAWIDPGADEIRSLAQYVVDLKSNLYDVCQIAKNSLRDVGQIQKHQYDRRTKPRQFAVGNRVLVLRPEKTNKLELSWKGPYRVVERVNPVDYRVQVERGIKTYHANLLKLFSERPVSLIPTLVSLYRGENTCQQKPLCDDRENLLQETPSNDTVEVSTSKDTVGYHLATLMWVDKTRELGKNHDRPILEVRSQPSLHQYQLTHTNCQDTKVLKQGHQDVSPQEQEFTENERLFLTVIWAIKESHEVILTTDIDIWIEQEPWDKVLKEAKDNKWSSRMLGWAGQLLPYQWRFHVLPIPRGQSQHQAAVRAGTTMTEDVVSVFRAVVIEEDEGVTPIVTSDVPTIPLQATETHEDAVITTDDPEFKRDIQALLA
ncbi:hypothetical protein ACOMHN_024764 [Nucella lapillus]